MRRVPAASTEGPFNRLPRHVYLCGMRTAICGMRTAILILAALLCGTVMSAQENTFRLTVLGYQWTTTHKTLTFSWPGYANTSCSGNANMNGYISSGGNVSASGTSSDTCSTTYTPPTNQNIDIQKPVVFILAD